jgi:O-methyltransferase
MKPATHQIARRSIKRLRAIRDSVEQVTGTQINRASLSAWIDDQIVKLLKRRVKRRKRLVEERGLQSTFRIALELLIDRKDETEMGDYLEFGVYNGSSMLCMYRALREVGLQDPRLIGFDSFEGLPQDADEAGWRPGDYRSSFEFTQTVLSLGGIDWSRAVLVQGWFEDTLNEGIARDHRIDKAGVIMIDCDLYSSAKEALDFCRPLIRDEVIIVFDDWHSGGLAEKGGGEKRAFDEFLKANPEFSSKYLRDISAYSDEAAAFLVARSA